LLLVAAASGCDEPLPPPSPPPQSSVAPAYGVRTVDITDSWIVVFRDDVADPAALAHGLVDPAGGEVRFVYRHALKGFAARLPEAAVEAITRNPNVLFVERDAHGQLAHVQDPAPWHLDRIDQRALQLDERYNYFYTGGDSNVNIYIIDTGIGAHWEEFGTRVKPGYTAIDDGAGTWDCNGHGTSVASVAAGSTVGVAKQAWLRPVRIGDCDGNTTNSLIVAGVDYVAGYHIHPAVANLGVITAPPGCANSPCSSSVEKSVQGLISKNVAVVVPAGNEAASACNYSPARMSEAITVASTDSSDTRAVSSNWGSCVDIFAPGRHIQTANPLIGYTIKSGTSFAAPAVAGVVALYLDANPNLTVPHLTQDLYTRSTKTTIANAGSGSPNRLLYSPDFRVYIGGPSQISEDGQYQWQAVHYGGGHHQPTSYLWEYKPANSSTWQTVGTSQTYSRYVTTADWDFQLRVTAHINDVYDIDWHDVVIGPACDPSDPLCPV
jgi:subtilisin family serine protease